MISERKRKYWQKKIRKIPRRFQHFCNTFKKHVHSKETFLKFLHKNVIKPFRIWTGLGGIKPWDFPLEIIHQSEDFVVINKSAGLLTHPTKRNEPDTALNALLHHLGMKGNKHHNMPGPISRLDRDTSGCILFALSKDAKSELGKLMQNRGFQKKYITLVKGEIKESGKITSPLLKDRHSRRMMAHHSGKAARTHFKRVQYFEKEDVSLVEVEILTGRMHQIRIHMKSIKHPLVGDILYGIDEVNKHFKKNYNLKRQFLHASNLSFTAHNLGEFSFQAPLSQDLETVLNQMA